MAVPQAEVAANDEDRQHGDSPAPLLAPQQCPHVLCPQVASYVTSSMRSISCKPQASCRKPALCPA